METLCAIALIIICAGTVGGLIYSVRRITEDAKERSELQFQQLRIERLIREAIETVLMPYWEQDERGLSMARKTIESALSKSGYLIGIEYETLKDKAGRVRGVRCRYRINGKEYDCCGLFASVPLLKERR